MKQLSIHSHEQTLSTIESFPRVWREQFKVRSYDIGPSKLITPHTVCQYLQEAASNHADLLGLSAERLAELDQMWVLSHLSLKILRYPSWRETLVVQTWPVTNSSFLRAYRDFKIHNDQGEYIGCASTKWLLLNQETRKPVKLPAWLPSITSAGLEPAILNDVKEIPAGSAATRVQSFAVRASDIDWNVHVNNVRYLDWAMESIPLELQLQYRVEELNIDFIGEGKFGDTVASEYFPAADSDPSGLHRILDQSSGKVLARLRIRWRPER
jgi:medium-chain acyl-[acyl-carrier-protein] hydrolase